MSHIIQVIGKGNNYTPTKSYVSFCWIRTTLSCPSGHGSWDWRNIVFRIYKLTWMWSFKKTKIWFLPVVSVVVGYVGHIIGSSSTTSSFIIYFSFQNLLKISFTLPLVLIQKKVCSLLWLTWRIQSRIETELS